MKKPKTIDVVGFLVRIGLQFLIRISPSERVVRVITPTTILIGLIRTLKLKTKIGSKLIFLGGLLNFIVVLANNGLMPVQRNQVKKIKNKSKNVEEIVKLPLGTWIKGTHGFVDEEKARLKFLSDRIALNIKYIGGIASIGDLIIFIGAIIAFLERLEEVTKKSQAYRIEPK